MKNYALLNKLDDKLIPIDNNYNKALVAVKTCSAIDEAKDWQDKMAALAYYHKQAGDKTLENYATRIRHFAQRRMGELLKEYDGKGNNQYAKKEDREDNLPIQTQKEVAESIGLSKWQQKESVRFANVPEEKFKEIVESENIPTKAEIAKLGTQTQVKYIDKSHKAIPFIKDLRTLISCMEKVDPKYIGQIMDEYQTKETLVLIARANKWFTQYKAHRKF